MRRVRVVGAVARFSANACWISSTSSAASAAMTAEVSGFGQGTFSLSSLCFGGVARKG